MQYTHIVGIDISKATIDVAVCQKEATAVILNRRFSNRLEGYEELLAWLEKAGIKLEQVLICLENTGLYHVNLVNFLYSKKGSVWIENAVEIKWSTGLVRGKSDKADAQRIGLYALKNQDKAKLYAAEDEYLTELSDLLTDRERLVKAKNMLLGPLKEKQDLGLGKRADRSKEGCKQSVAALNKDIKGIEKQIAELVKSSKELSKNYKLIRSVKGIGMITALYLIKYTQNFKRLTNPKKLASYCGIAPFEYSSGTSIRGKNKVHPMSNKVLKKLLHMCALSSVPIQEGEMRAYYERKVGEGKNKMSVLNAIRNKLIHRVCACIRDQKVYSYKQVA
ncbi:MAG: hypothetical protein BGO68_02240 [Candidatus Amoebophilus sp. 36-38]|nr:MAG: hypothetical protein BGO68_02240 [Candidatus Amoebophilus sp. 36-38]